MDKEFRISITSGTVITSLMIVLGVYVLWLLRDLVLLVLTAIVIASSVEPGIVFLIRRRIPRFISATIVYSIVLGSFFSLIYFFLPPIISDAAGFFSTAPKYFDTLDVSTSLSSLTNATNLISNNGGTESLVRTLLSLQSVFAESSAGVMQLIVTFFGGIFSLILVIVLSFYFALQDTGVDDFLRLVMPVAYEDYSVDLWKRAQKKIGLWMQGQLLLSIIVGVLVYLGLLILEVPYALLISVFTGLAEIIPIFGSLIAGLLAVFVGFSSGGVALATIILGLYIVVNQFESNLIYPLIVKKVVGIPPLMVIIALIAGLTLAGFLGALLSVPMAAVALEFVYDFDKRKRRTQRSQT